MRSGNPRRLSKDLLYRLSELGRTRRYERGDLIIKEGSRSDGVYVLLAGSAQVFAEDAHERRLIYNKIAAGEIFGEMLLDGGARSASVIATSDCECIRIKRDELQAFIEQHPAFAHTLILVLIGRLRNATAQAKRLGLHDVGEHVAHLLTAEAIEVNGKRQIPRELTQQEIADRIGATREMVNLVIRRFIRGGYLVRTADRSLQLLKALPGAGGATK